MEIRPLAAAEPFVTPHGRGVRSPLHPRSPPGQNQNPAAAGLAPADGSVTRSLLALGSAPVQNQSLAEASLAPGQATTRHYHAASEELYYLVEGRGEMEVDGERSAVAAGDAILIPPGAWHQIRA